MIYPVRWRVYLAGGSLCILAFGLAWTTMMIVRVALGWDSGVDLAERILSGWANGNLLGLFQMVFSGERHRNENRILVNAETIVGPRSNGKVAQIPPDNVRMTRYEGGNWLRKVAKTWTLQAVSYTHLTLPTSDLV